MSKATEDLGRLAVTKFVKIAIESEKAATGESEQEIARRVLGDWARKKHRAYKVYARSLRENGLQLELDGIDTEDDGDAPGGKR